MADLNLEAARAEFEGWFAKYSPNTNIARRADGFYEAENLNALWDRWLVDAGFPARRAAPAAAQLDADNLPPLPPHIEVGGEGWGLEDFQSWKTFTAEDMEQYARKARAQYAERIRLLTEELAAVCGMVPSQMKVPKQSIGGDLQSALDAEFPMPESPHASVIQRAKDARHAMGIGWLAGVRAALARRDHALSIRYDTDFRCLLRNYREAHSENETLLSELIAYIDGRTAGTAVPEGYVIAPAEATEAMVHAAQDLPPPRMFGVVYRTMIAAAPSTQENANGN